MSNVNLIVAATAAASRLRATTTTPISYSATTTTTTTTPPTRGRSGPSSPLEGLGLEGVPENSELMLQRRRDAQEDQEEQDQEEQEEEEEEMIESVLEVELGLYQGSYKHLCLVYTLSTTLTTLLVFLLLFLIPIFLLPSPSPSSQPGTDNTGYPYTRLFRFPLPEIVIGFGMWGVQHILRGVVFGMRVPPRFTFLLLPRLRFPRLVLLFLPAFTYAIIQVLARLCIPMVLGIPQFMQYTYPTFLDGSFRQLFTASTTYSLAESVLVIRHGYEAIGAYRDVLVTVRPLASGSRGGGGVEYETGRERVKHDDDDEDDDDDLSVSRLSGERLPLLPPPVVVVDTPEEDEDEGDAQEERMIRDEEMMLDSLLRARKRREIDDVYGVAFIKIPPFLPPLQRISSPLFSIGMTLLLSWAWVKSPLALALTSTSTSTSGNPVYLGVVFPLSVLVVMGLDVLSVSGKRVGPQTIIYLTFLVSLLVFFGGLGVWDLL